MQSQKLESKEAKEQKPKLKSQSFGISNKPYQPTHIKHPGFNFKPGEACGACDKCAAYGQARKVEALAAYKTARMNGEDLDDPCWSFPNDGKYNWGPEAEYYGCTVYYTEGENDHKWMTEKDRNYLTRLHLTGTKTPQEQQDLANNSDYAAKAAEEVARLPIEQLSVALRNQRLQAQTTSSSDSKDIKAKKQPKMKVQTYGVSRQVLVKSKNFNPVEFFPGTNFSTKKEMIRRGYKEDSWQVSEPINDYRANRENGNNDDNPKKEFPCDGTYTWENSSASESKIQYTEGLQDRAWMVEKDRNYLARLHMVRAHTPQEQQELANNSELAAKAAKEIAKLPKEQLSVALRNQSSKLKAQTYGIGSYLGPGNVNGGMATGIPLVDGTEARRKVQEASVKDYRANRENGDEKDSPKEDFVTGENYSWVTPNESYSKVLYTEGERAHEWMAEKDRNYLARLFLTQHTVQLTQQEKQDLTNNSELAAKAAKEIAKLPKEQLSVALRAYKEKEEKAHQEHEAKEQQLEIKLFYVSVGSNNDIWGLNNMGQIYHRTKNNLWEQVQGSLKQISVGSDGEVWGVWGKRGEIFHYTGTAPNIWEVIPRGITGGLKHVAVGKKGNVWGVNANDVIYHYVGNQWEQVSGSLKQISVSSDGDDVWGLHNSGGIRRYTGGSPNAWKEIYGGLKHISVGKKGDVWGVNGGNIVYHYVGNQWEQVRGSLKQVSVGSDGEVWGVSEDNNVYYYDKNSNAWEHVYITGAEGGYTSELPKLNTQTYGLSSTALEQYIGDNAANPLIVKNGVTLATIKEWYGRGYSESSNHIFLLACREARKNYRDMRENGDVDDVDADSEDFPNDGIYKWETPDMQPSKVRYTEGLKDAAWMAKKDRNYLARLEIGGTEPLHPKPGDSTTAESEDWSWLGLEKVEVKQDQKLDTPINNKVINDLLEAIRIDGSNTPTALLRDIDDQKWLRLVLREAIIFDRVDIVKDIVRKDRNIVEKYRDNLGNGPWHLAAKFGSLKTYTYFLNEGFATWSEANNLQQQALHIASYYDQRAIAEHVFKKYSLLSKAAIVYFQGHKLRLTPLQIAVLLGNLRMYDFLKSKQGLSLSVPSIGNLLHLAILSGNPQMLRRLVGTLTLDNDVLNNHENPFQLTPLDLAVYRGDGELVRILIEEAKANINFFGNEREETAVFAAVRGRQKEIVKLLIYLKWEEIKLYHENNKGSDVEKLAKYLSEWAEHNNREQERISYTSIAKIIHNQKASMERIKYQAPDYEKSPIRNLVFKGGGPKGIAYVGVLQAFQERFGSEKMSEIKRVAGTSAGAITALFLALGYTPEQMGKRLGTTRLTDFLEGVDIGRLKAGGFLNILWETLKVAYRTNNGDSLWSLLNPVGKIFSLTGLSSGDKFLKWINESIKIALKERGFYKPNLTFKDLRDIINENPAGPFKHLYVVATKVGSQTAPPEIIVFNSNDPWCGNILVADAVRASMSIPFIFEPYTVRERNTATEDPHPLPGFTCVDGGLLGNYPLNLFDTIKYQNTAVLPGEADYPYFNRETLGFYLTPGSCDTNPSSQTELIPEMVTQISQGLSSIPDLVAALEEIYGNAEPLISGFKGHDDIRTIKIKDCGVSLLDFGLTPETNEYKALIKSGREAIYAKFSDSTVEIVHNSTNAKINLAASANHDASGWPWLLSWEVLGAGLIIMGTGLGIYYLKGAFAFLALAGAQAFSIKEDLGQGFSNQLEWPGITTSHNSNEGFVELDTESAIRVRHGKKSLFVEPNVLQNNITELFEIRNSRKLTANKVGTNAQQILPVIHLGMTFFTPMQISDNNVSKNALSALSFTQQNLDSKPMEYATSQTAIVSYNTPTLPNIQTNFEVDTTKQEVNSAEKDKAKEGTNNNFAQNQTDKAPIFTKECNQTSRSITAQGTFWTRWFLPVVSAVNSMASTAKSWVGPSSGSIPSGDSSIMINAPIQANANDSATGQADISSSVKYNSDFNSQLMLFSVFFNSLRKSFSYTFPWNRKHVLTVSEEKSLQDMLKIFPKFKKQIELLAVTPAVKDGFLDDKFNYIRRELTAKSKDSMVAQINKLLLKNAQSRIVTGTQISDWQNRLEKIQNYLHQIEDLNEQFVKIEQTEKDYLEKNHCDNLVSTRHYDVINNKLSVTFSRNELFSACTSFFDNNTQSSQQCSKHTFPFWQSEQRLIQGEQQNALQLKA